MSRSFVKKTAGLFSAIFLISGALFAQSTAEKYLISAKAGGINYVEGSSSVISPSGATVSAIKGVLVKDGETVNTSADARVEVLLNPGSFVRLGAMSDVKFDSTDLNDVRISVNSGSAVLEIFATNEFTVSVNTPKSSVLLTKTGVYRFDVQADGASRLSVIEGDVRIGKTQVKSGRMIDLGAANSSTVKFDKKKSDSLTAWSKTRSDSVAKMTNSLREDTLRTSLLSSLSLNHWNFWNSFGLWVYSPRYGGYCFLPFGTNWYSPYGYWYRYGFFNYSWPDWVWTRVNTPPVNNTPVTTPGNSPVVPTKRNIPVSASVRPPYETVAPVRGSGQNTPVRTRNESIFDSSQPVRVSTPRSAPTITAAPAPAPKIVTAPVSRPRNN